MRNTHRYPLRDVLGWFLFIVAALVLLWAVLAQATPQVDVVGCRQTKHPEVCAASYHKCNNIGLDDACLAVAQLDGEAGHSITQNASEPMSQNNKTGEKPVERVHN